MPAAFGVPFALLRQLRERTELPMAAWGTPLHFALDQTFHLAQTFKNPVVDIAAVDERTHRGRI